MGHKDCTLSYRFTEGCRDIRDGVVGDGKNTLAPLKVLVAKALDDAVDGTALYNYHIKMIRLILIRHPTDHL